MLKCLILSFYEDLRNINRVSVLSFIILKKKRLSYKLLFILFFGPLVVAGQILDDSTRQVYGFKTVGYRFERNIFVNDTTYRVPDSTLGYVHRASPVEIAEYNYQDLGNIGTASRPTHFLEPQTAGIQIGFNSFDLYRQKKSEIKYYNTRSPYTLMQYLQTNRGGAYFDFIHSQNISSRFNITLDINRTASSKQINPGSNREERLINGWNTVFSTNYSSESGKYTVAAHYNQLNFQQIEQGGILYDRNQFFFPLDSVTLYSNRITGSISRTIKNSWYGLQQLKLSNGFDAFHRLEVENNTAGFRDGNIAGNADQSFYNFIAADPDTIDWRIRNYTVQNTFGLKGYYKGYLANVYVKHRFVNASFKDSTTLSYSTNVLSRNEFLIGGGFRASFRDSLLVLNADAEINLPKSFVVNSNMRLKGLSLGFSLANTIPDLIFTRFATIPGYEWNNDFRNQTVSAFSGSYAARVGEFNLSAFAKLQLIDNYLYFDNSNRPTQKNTGVLTLLSTGLTAKIKLGKFYFDNDLAFNQSSDEVFPVPTFTNNFLVYYEFNYAGTLDLRVGLDNFYKTAYYAPAYNPVIQQFYIQNNVKVWGYNLTDAFVSFMVNKVRLSLKFGHVNQGFLPKVSVQENGNSIFANKAFIATPNYPGLRRSFNIRVIWPLFD